MITEGKAPEVQVERPAPDAAKTAERRIQGLDSLRMILACWVVVAHISLFEYVKVRGGPAVKAITGNMFVGVAAVMAFFVISGFCIHLPYSRGRNLSLRSYFVRREVRMLIPVAVAIALGYVLQSFKYITGLWSLVCEEVYYAIYPIILIVRRKYRWTPIFTFAIVGSILVNLFGVHKDGTFHEVGYALTWLLAFPVWLLGAVLAEQAETGKDWAFPRWTIWLARGGVWAVSMAISAIRFHSHLDYQITLVPFGVLLYYWMKMEVAYFRVYAPHPALERAGKASYTLYLTHMFAPTIVTLIGLPITGALNWAWTLVVTAILCYLLYRLVEGPSHTLARNLGKRIDARGKAKG
jgi:peptidoglycan/LPS O-acetylase OafA/YrhL